MRMRLRSLLLFPAVLFLLSGCMPNGITPHSVTDSAAVPGGPKARRSIAENAATVRQQARQLLAAGNYQAALALLLGSGVPGEMVAEEHGRALRGILRQAEGYRSQGLPEKAGPLYRAALDGYPKTRDTAGVGKRTEDISDGIEACADELMERGLSAYRGGDLARAIADWKLIGAFAPGHQPSRKALETAEVQLANLKKVREEK